MKIYDGNLPLEKMGYHACVVRLKAGLGADLHWKEAKEMAEQLADRQLGICWEFDFGREEQQRGHSFDDETHLRSLGLALEHFEEELYAKFEEITRAFILARMRWSSPAFAKTLDRLAFTLPEGHPALLLLDLEGCTSPAEEAMWLAKRYSGDLLLAIKGSRLPPQEWGWDVVGPFGGIGCQLSKSCPERATRALLLPETVPEEQRGAFDEWLERHMSSGDSLRLIGEERLTVEWDGLDELTLFPGNLYHPLSQRAIDGFCAAGGSLAETP